MYIKSAFGELETIYQLSTFLLESELANEIEYMFLSDIFEKDFLILSQSNKNVIVLIINHKSNHELEVMRCSNNL